MIRIYFLHRALRDHYYFNNIYCGLTHVGSSSKSFALWGKIALTLFNSVIPDCLFTQDEEKNYKISQKKAFLSRKDLHSVTKKFSMVRTTVWPLNM